MPMEARELYWVWPVREGMGMVMMVCNCWESIPTAVSVERSPGVTLLTVSPLASVDCVSVLVVFWLM